MRRMYSQKQLEEMIAKGQVALVVGNVKELNDKQCEKIQCGDVVVKTTDNQKHAYIVTYKENGVGLCLSYFDASCVETQSYDYTDGHWVYNSQDLTTFADLGHTDAEVKALAKDEVESASSGTIQDALGLDSSGNLVKGSVSGGSKLYKHYISITNNNVGQYIILISDDNTPIATIIDIYRHYRDHGIMLKYSTTSGSSTQYNNCIITNNYTGGQTWVQIIHYDYIHGASNPQFYQDDITSATIVSDTVTTL